MKRMRSDILAFSGAFLLLAAYIAGGYAAAPAGAFLTSFLPAAGILLACGILLYFLNEKTLSGISILVPTVYLVLATAHPDSLRFAPFHAAVLLVAVSLFFYLTFTAIRPSTDYLAASCIFLGAAAMIEPPMLWLAPVLTLSAVGKAEEKGKFWAAAVLALFLPFFAWYGISYLRGQMEPLATVFAGLWTRMTDFGRTDIRFSDVTLLRIALVALSVLLAIVSTVKRLGTYKIAQFRTSVRLIILTLAFSLLTLLFYHSSAVPAGMFTALPAAPLIGECLSRTADRKTTRTLTLIVVLVLLAERAARLLQ